MNVQLYTHIRKDKQYKLRCCITYCVLCGRCTNAHQVRAQQNAIRNRLHGKEIVWSGDRFLTRSDFWRSEWKRTIVTNIGCSPSRSQNRIIFFSLRIWFDLTDWNGFFELFLFNRIGVNFYSKTHQTHHPCKYLKRTLAWVPTHYSPLQTGKKIFMKICNTITGAAKKQN